MAIKHSSAASPRWSATELATLTENYPHHSTQLQQLLPKATPTPNLMRRHLEPSYLQYTRENTAKSDQKVLQSVAT